MGQDLESTAYSRSHALRGNADSDAPASEGRGAPQQAFPRGAWERGVKELQQLLGPLVNPLLRDQTGALDLSKIPAKDFAEFKQFLITQVKVDNIAFNATLFASYQKVLEKEEFEPLLQALYDKTTVSADLLKKFQADLIAVDAEKFVGNYLHTAEGRRRLHHILGDSTHYTKEIHCELIKALVIVGENQNIAERDWASLSHHISTWNYFNWWVSEEDRNAAVRRAQELLESADFWEDVGQTIQTRYLEEPEKVSVIQNPFLKDPLTPEKIKKMAALLEEKKGTKDAVSDLQGKLVRFWLFLIDAATTPAASHKNQAWLVKKTEELLEKAASIQTDKEFKDFNEELQDFLNGPLQGEGDAISNWLDHKISGKGLAELCEPLDSSRKAAYTELKLLSDQWAHAIEMGKKPGVRSFSSAGAAEAAHSESVQKAKAELSYALEQAGIQLWYGYKQDKAINRGISQLQDKPLLSSLFAGLPGLIAGAVFPKGKYGDLAKIRNANAELDRMIERLEKAATKEDVQKEINHLYEILKEGGVLQEGFLAAEINGAEKLLGVVQTVGIILGTTLVLRGLGTSKILADAAKVANGVKNLQTAAGATRVAEVVEKVGTVGLQAAQQSRIARVAAAEVAGAESIPILARVAHGMKWGAYIQPAEHVVAIATGEVRQESDNLLNWAKDSASTSLAMGLFTPFAMSLGGTISRNVFRGLIQRYAGVRGVGTWLGDAFLEAPEEGIDQVLNSRLKGKSGALGWSAVREIGLVSGFGGGMKVGAIAEAFRPPTGVRSFSSASAEDTRPEAAGAAKAAHSESNPFRNPIFAFATMFLGMGMGGIGSPGGKKRKGKKFSPTEEKIEPPPPPPTISPPQFTRHMEMDEPTLQKMEAFPERIRTEHGQRKVGNKIETDEAEAEEAQQIFYGLNHMNWWLWLIQQNVADLGAEAIVEGGKILFARWQEIPESQKEAEKKLKEISDQAITSLRWQAPDAEGWWRPMWEREKGRGEEGKRGRNIEILAAILQQLARDNSELAEEWLQELAEENVELSVEVQGLLEDPGVRSFSSASAAEAAHSGLQSLAEQNDWDGVNQKIAELYTEALQLQDPIESLQRILALQEAVSKLKPTEQRLLSPEEQRILLAAMRRPSPPVPVASTISISYSEYTKVRSEILEMVEQEIKTGQPPLVPSNLECMDPMVYWARIGFILQTFGQENRAVEMFAMADQEPGIQARPGSVLAEIILEARAKIKKMNGGELDSGPWASDELEELTRRGEFSHALAKIKNYNFDSTLTLKLLAHLAKHLATALPSSSLLPPGSLAMIPGKTYKIGRSKSKSDIVINDATVDREHAEIKIQGNKVIVKDLDSTNGTFFGSTQAIPNTEEPTMDEIRIGPGKIKNEIDPNADSNSIIAMVPGQDENSWTLKTIPVGGVANYGLILQRIQQLVEKQKAIISGREGISHIYGKALLGWVMKKLNIPGGDITIDKAKLETTSEEPTEYYSRVWERMEKDQFPLPLMNVDQTLNESGKIVEMAAEGKWAGSLDMLEKFEIENDEPLDVVDTLAYLTKELLWALQPVSEESAATLPNPAVDYINKILAQQPIQSTPSSPPKGKLVAQYLPRIQKQVEELLDRVGHFRDWRDRAVVLAHLGGALNKLGLFSEAVSYFNEAFELIRNVDLAKNNNVEVAEILSGQMNGRWDPKHMSDCLLAIQEFGDKGLWEDALKHIKISGSEVVKAQALAYLAKLMAEAENTQRVQAATPVTSVTSFSQLDIDKARDQVMAFIEQLLLRIEVEKEGDDPEYGNAHYALGLCGWALKQLGDTRGDDFIQEALDALSIVFRNEFEEEKDRIHRIAQGDLPWENFDQPNFPFLIESIENGDLDASINKIKDRNADVEVGTEAETAASLAYSLSHEIQKRSISAILSQLDIDKALEQVRKELVLLVRKIDAEILANSHFDTYYAFALCGWALKQLGDVHGDELIQRADAEFGKGIDTEHQEQSDAVKRIARGEFPFDPVTDPDHPERQEIIDNIKAGRVEEGIEHIHEVPSSVDKDAEFLVYVVHALNEMKAAAAVAQPTTTIPDLPPGAIVLPIGKEFTIGKRGTDLGGGKRPDVEIDGPNVGPRPMRLRIEANFTVSTFTMNDFPLDMGKDASHSDANAVMAIFQDPNSGTWMIRSFPKPWPIPRGYGFGTSGFLSDGFSGTAGPLLSTLPSASFELLKNQLLPEQIQDLKESLNIDPKYWQEFPDFSQAPISTAACASDYFSQLPKRDITTVPKQYRHLIPKKKDIVFFDRFRKIINETAALLLVPDRVAVRFFGPAGTGKTTIPEVLAEAMGIPLLREPLSRRTDASDLEGLWSMEVVDGKSVPVFKEGAPTIAMEHGFHIVFDEPDLARPNVLAFLNNVTAPGEYAWVRKKSGQLVKIKVHEDYRAYATENAREEHGRDFLRRFVHYYVGPPTKEELTKILVEKFESYGGQRRWDRRTSQILAYFHDKMRIWAQGVEDPETEETLAALGDSIGQRIEFTPRSLNRLAWRLVASGPVTEESLSRAIRAEYILPVANPEERSMIWEQAKVIFKDAIGIEVGPDKIPTPTMESISQKYLGGRKFPKTSFTWTDQALRLLEETLWNESLGIDVFWLGDPSEGKTREPPEIAKVLHLEYMRKNISPETDEEDLVGGYGRVNGKTDFVRDVLTIGVEEGDSLVHFDEYLLAETGKVESVMNPLMDDARALILKNPYRVISRPKRLLLLFTSNFPWADEKKRHEHSAAAMSRMAVICLTGEFGMQPADRRKIMKEWMGRPFGKRGEEGKRGRGEEDPVARGFIPAETGKDSAGKKKDLSEGSGVRSFSSASAEGAPVSALEVRPLAASGAEAPHSGSGKRHALSPFRHMEEVPTGEENEEEKKNKSPILEIPIQVHPEVRGKYDLPPQLAMVINTGPDGSAGLMETGEDGFQIPIVEETLQELEKYSKYLTWRTKVEMTLITGKAFKIHYRFGGPHVTSLTSKEIHLNEPKLLKMPVKATLFVAKHEYAHAIIDGPSEKYDSAEPLRLYANAVGDPRMNEYGASLRPDFRPQMLELMDIMWPEQWDEEHIHNFREKLPHEQFTNGVIYAWRFGKIIPYIENEKVIHALEQALPILQPAFTLFPESLRKHHVEKALDEFYRILDEAYPFYEELIEESKKELKKRREAGESMEDLMNPMRPSAAGGDSSPHSGSEDEEIISMIINVRAEKLADQFEPKDPEAFKERKAQIVAVRAGKSTGEGSQTVGAIHELPLQEEEMRKIEAKRQKVLKDKMNQELFLRMLPKSAIKEARKLKRFLPPDNPTRLDGFYTRGKRVHRNKAAQDQMKPRPDGKIMLRFVEQEEHDVNLVKITDITYSITSAGASENVLRSSAAATYLSEQLQFNYAEILLGSEARVAKPLGSILHSYKKKNELLNTIQQGFADGKINGSTNIREPLALAIEMIKKRKASSNYILLITDGQEIDTHYPKTLQELQTEAEKAGIHVMVLAMGEAQRYVPGVFKHYKFVRRDGSDIPEKTVELFAEAHRKRLIKS